MNEKYKKKFDELKTKAKQNWPTIAASVVAGAASALAVHYRNELANNAVDHQTTFIIPEPLIEKMRDGAILKYRCVKTADGYDEEYTFTEFEEEESDS